MKTKDKVKFKEHKMTGVVVEVIGCSVVVKWDSGEIETTEEIINLIKI